MRLSHLVLPLALLWPALAAAQVHRASEPPTRLQLALDTRPGGASPNSTPATRIPDPVEPAPTRPPRPPSTTQDQDDDAPMRFQLVREGPAESCGKTCRTWVMASGRITLETGHDFETFARGRDLNGAIVVLDSNGGAVDGGLDLGRAFRRLNLTVTVGKTKILSDADGGPRARLLPGGTCASMCPFALLGGSRRHVPAEARVLVHQIWPSAKREDAAAQTYTAENLTSLQRSLGKLARYTVEMGGDVELFELAMRIPPWERMRTLTADELQRLHLRTIDDPFGAPSAAVTPVTPTPAAAPKPAPLPIGGWMITERGGLRGLARRHPLTIEGDEIGSFEIMFACGDAPDAYALRYTETRRPPGDSDRLNKVVIASGKDRVTLTIESSAKNANDLESTARGAIPSSVLSALAETGQHSIVVATETSTNVRTLIRVGNTGLDEAFPQLVKTCRR